MQTSNSSSDKKKKKLLRKEVQIQDFTEVDHEYDKAKKRAQDAYAGAKLKISGYPEVEEDVVQMPSNLTRYSSKALGRLISGYTAMSNYVENITSIANSTLKIEEAKSEQVEDSFYVAFMSQGYASTEAKAKARIMPEYKKAKARYLEAYTKHSMLEASLNNYNKSISVVSREMSRRMGEGNTVGMNRGGA